MRMQRPVPGSAYAGVRIFAGCALGIAVLALAAPMWHEGLSWFFRGGADPHWFLEVGRAPLGNGDAFRRLGSPFEASYRYGRIGYPLLGWVLALGHPPWVGGALVLCSFAAIVAVPLLAMTLVEVYGAPPLGGLLTALVPGLYLLVTHAYSDAVLVAVLLLGFIFEGRGRRAAAQGTFAFAALVKETAILAIVAMFVRAVRRRDANEARGWALAVVPYVVWMCWVRFRVGEFPFLADDRSRRNALSAPLVGLVHAWRTGSSPVRGVVLIVCSTAVLGTMAAWKARSYAVSGTTAAFSLFALCSGSATLPYPGDTLRILMVAQVLGIVCAVCAWNGRRRRGAPATMDAWSPAPSPGASPTRRAPISSSMPKAG